MFDLGFKNKILEDLKSGIKIRNRGILTIFDSIEVVEPGQTELFGSDSVRVPKFISNNHKTAKLC